MHGIKTMQHFESVIISCLCIKINIIIFWKSLSKVQNMIENHSKVHNIKQKKIYIFKLLCFNFVSDINHKTSFQNNTTWKLLTIINHNHKFNFSLMTKFVIWPINQVNIEEELFATFTRFMRLMKPEVQVNQLIILTVSVN